MSPALCVKGPPTGRVPILVGRETRAQKHDHAVRILMLPNHLLHEIQWMPAAVSHTNRMHKLKLVAAANLKLNNRITHPPA